MHIQQNKRGTYWYLLHWYPSFYHTESPHQRMFCWLGIWHQHKLYHFSVATCLTTLMPFIQNPIGKHYMPFNSLKTRSVASRKTMWKATEFVANSTTFPLLLPLCQKTFPATLMGWISFLDEGMNVKVSFSDKTVGLHG